MISAKTGTAIVNASPSFRLPNPGSGKQHQPGRGADIDRIDHVRHGSGQPEDSVADEPGRGRRESLLEPAQRQPGHVVADHLMQPGDHVHRSIEVLHHLEIADDEVDDGEHRQHDQPTTDAQPPGGFPRGKSGGRRQQRQQCRALDDPDHNRQPQAEVEESPALRGHQVLEVLDHARRASGLGHPCVRGRARFPRVLDSFGGAHARASFAW